MSTIDPLLPVPEALTRVEAYDAALARELAQVFGRLAGAGRALVWAQERLPALVATSGSTGVLQLLVDESRRLTGVEEVWALTWRGSLQRGSASFRALAGGSGVDGASPPGPADISSTVVGRVVKDGQAAWSDDAQADARFLAAESVTSFSLRSVGCVPVGSRGVLYLSHPEPGRFALDCRLKIGALCNLAAPFLDPERPRRARTGASEPVLGMIGDSPAMAEVYDAVRAFAPMPWPVLVLGETGTGKELVARAIHALSPRPSAPFVAVNCGAILEGVAESTLFGAEKGSHSKAERRHIGVVERAGEGTLFLDEIGELAPPLQVKLLRVLQDGSYERLGGEQALRFPGRVIAATNRDLDDPESRGAFREDLFHRLAACVIRLPALRERRDDIPALAAHLLERACAELDGAPPLRLSEEAVGSLSAQSWPGNVRDLENALRAAVARCLVTGGREITAEHLRARDPTASSGGDYPDDLAEAVEAFQRHRVLAALEACGDNRTRAAERLGVSRQWLHRLLSRWEARQ